MRESRRNAEYVKPKVQKRSEVGILCVAWPANTAIFSERELTFVTSFELAIFL